jgi:hypothetical protein
MLLPDRSTSKGQVRGPLWAYPAAASSTEGPFPVKGRNSPGLGVLTTAGARHIADPDLTVCLKKGADRSRMTALPETGCFLLIPATLWAFVMDGR